MTLLLILLIIYRAWCYLEKYNKVDYGNKQLNRLMGLNQLLCRKYHRLGDDFWLDIPSEGGCIIAANHQSGMDPAVLMAISKRPVRFLATDYYCNMPVVCRLLKTAGCIPVYRNKDNKLALQAAIEALKNGEVIGIFPFGGIHLPTREEPRIRSGVAVLSKFANVPIYPVYIGGVAKFSFNKIFTSMFFKRSNLKVIPFEPVKCDVDSDDLTSIQEFLYENLSNHLNYNKYAPKEIHIDQGLTRQP